MTQLGQFAIPVQCRSEPVLAARVSEAAVILSLYGTAHLVVDAICAAVVVSAADLPTVRPATFAGLVLLYHVLAFGLQAIFGLAVDALGTPRLAAMLGCLVSATALLIPSQPLLAIGLAGVGNALFHVGGGHISLGLTPGRATVPGLFVAPGSVGLLLGVVLGKSAPSASLTLLPVAVVLGLIMVRTPVLRTAPAATGPGLPALSEVVLGLVLVSITIRSLLGFLVIFPWETQPVLLVALTVATVCGKALGGWLADRWGWVRVGVGATVAAVPFLACAAAHPVAAIPGLLLLNLAMPVTLAAVARAVPGYPGFAFGLTCLALLLGALPALLGVAADGPVFVSLVVLLSAAVLYRGLRSLSFDDSFRQPVQV